ncbi:ABC transporter permease subunit [Nocardia vinacea]|uniref:ABC transporter permease subunit n=1 Tax=Nocardia vinacea TaxID=96468 RepID=UPI0033EE767D
MTRYLLRRLPSAVLVLFAASVLIFLLLRLVPGDPALTLAGPDASPETIAAIRHQLGLDRSIPAQYVTWLENHVILAFPSLIFAIALAAITGPGIHAVIAVIIAVEIPVFGRQIRTAILQVREQPFVEAAEVIGAGTWWNLRKHVLPNVVEPLSVQLALSMSVAVFVEGAMSFIGIGVRPPDPSLGSIIAESISNLDANAAFAIGPLVVVAGLTLGFLLIAQALGRARRIG